MRTKTFVVVGVGNFGSWWVNGLLRQEGPVEVFCLDPAFGSRKRLRERLSELPKRLARGSSIVFAEDAGHLPPSSDLVIIATNADIRHQVLCDITAVHESRGWVLEKPLAQSVHQIMDQFAMTAQQNILVNHSRPIQPASLTLQGLIDRFDSPRAVHYRGGRFEMANNASHFVHLAQSLLRLRFRDIVHVELADHWHRSRTRKGFLDVRGVVVAGLEQGVELTLDWSHDDLTSADWTFYFDHNTISYDEVTGEIRLNDSLSAVVPLMNFSDLVSHLCRTGDTWDIPISGLPRLLDVLHIHLSLTDTFARHYRNSSGVGGDFVPFG